MTTEQRDARDVVREQTEAPRMNVYEVTSESTYIALTGEAAARAYLDDIGGTLADLDMEEGSEEWPEPMSDEALLTARMAVCDDDGNVIYGEDDKVKTVTYREALDDEIAKDATTARFFCGDDS